MTDIDLTSATHRLSELVASISDDELGLVTPCPAYTLGDLVDHVGGLALVFAAAGRKETGRYVNMGPSGDVARLTDDWRTRIPRDLGLLAQAWREPGAWTGMTRVAGQDAPAAMVGITAADELVVHGWDIARAIGQDYDAEPALIEAAREFLEAFVSPSPDMPSGPTVAFGPPRPVSDDAPLLDQVLAMAGRDPLWTPRSRSAGRMNGAG